MREFFERRKASFSPTSLEITCQKQYQIKLKKETFLHGFPAHLY
jgi:hypothetical protein